MLTADQLRKRTRIAATIGTKECLEVLRERRDEIVAQIPAVVPTANDPHCYAAQRKIGELQAINFLINMGVECSKPTETKGKANGRPATAKLPTF